MTTLEDLAQRGDHAALIATVRDRITQDRRAVTDPAIKLWLGRRWRDLFLSAAAADPRALRTASAALGTLSGKRDRRPPRQKIAERFLRGDSILEWSVTLPAVAEERSRKVTLVFCAGLLNGLLPDHAFRDEFVALNTEQGWPILRADIHPMRGCEPNVEDIRRAIDEGQGMRLDGSRQPQRHEPPGDVILMGYSKGGPDILAFLARYPQYRDRVRAVILWAGAVGGSYTADGIHDSIKDLDLTAAYQRLNDFLKLFSPFVQPRQEGIFRRVDEYDIKGALKDLTTHERGGFLRQYGAALDAMNIPFFTFTAATSFLRVPSFQMHDAIRLGKFDANNDMQLTQAQAKVHLPMETHLATLHGHHWDISYPPFPRAARLGSPNLDHPFPRKAALTAIFQLLGEVGLLS